MASKFFDAVGRTVIVDEKHMDAVTGLSASGPAYIYIILESLAEAGVKVGLPPMSPLCWLRRLRWARRELCSRLATIRHCLRTPSLLRPAAQLTASWNWKRANCA